LWLGIAIDLISPTFLPRIKSWIEGTNQSLAGAALLVTAYCLGSAILPISAQLVNDEHWPLPEDAIRCRVTEEEQSRLKLVKYSSLTNPQVARSHGSACACSLWSRVRGGGKTNPKRTPTASLVRNEAVSKEQLYGADGQQKVILAQFEVLENRALGQGTNRDEFVPTAPGAHDCSPGSGLQRAYSVLDLPFWVHCAGTRQAHQPVAYISRDPASTTVL